ncbi:initiation-control protein YabA [Nosocomiicoccus ampullae]|uniref:initiation-control protein YabA n=1 Tax=Nosocomiicoccus ampullae TaxID=489910 RepID=UPI00214F3C60|nr:DNA replication initiation control protein YabA [Nosocomiicoccus ampullae]
MRDELFEHILKMENHLDTLNEEFEELKQRTVKLLEENVRLEMENKNFKELLKETTADKEKTKKETFKSNTLQSLYDEGFHVCNVSFGTHRHGEKCLFCQEILTRDL